MCVTFKIEDFFPKLDQSSANTHTHIITHSQGDADVISMTVDSQ